VNYYYFCRSKAVISITDQRVLFDKIVEGMVYVSEADYGWLQIRDDHLRTFVLAAHRNLPDAWAKKMGQPLDDGISSLVALSGETLAINGEPLKRFRVVSLGLSAVVCSDQNSAGSHRVAGGCPQNEPTF